MQERSSRLRWAVPSLIVLGIFAVAVFLRVRMGPDAMRDFKEDSLPEIGQAVFLGLGCVLCLWAMMRSGRKRADFYWWITPAFISFFMFWREAEIDSDWLGLGENAFTWKYLFEGHMPIWKRLVLGIPSTSLAIGVLVVCLKRVKLLVAALKRREVSVGVLLFAVGIGLYLVAQVLDRANYLLREYGFRIWGVRAHRDDFWEEFLELAGAAAILMGVLDHFRHRPVISGALEEAEAALVAREKASISPDVRYTRSSSAATESVSARENTREGERKKESQDAAVSDATDCG